ncbi:MAG TPA: hypothetical protein VK439_09025, partial [Rubrivivax sp.]|nr:hypothetical protein [Rubrivivax sp.]
FITAPFHGLVVDAGRPLGSYRLHGKSAPEAPGYTGNFSVTMATEVRLNYSSRDQALALLRSRSGIDVQGPFLTLPTHVRHRVISFRLAPDAHPHREDTATGLWRLMNDSLRECPGYSGPERWAMRLWTAGVLLLPKLLARKLMNASRATLVWGRLSRLSQRWHTPPRTGHLR